MTPSYLTVPDTNIKLAYHQTIHKTPKGCVLFLSGFRSDMEGGKARWLEEACEAHEIDFVRFDYSGHGKSDKAFVDCTISDWVRDARTIIENLFDKPTVLVGSSMGGWIALLLARDHPDKVAGLVGIAAAPDFTDRLRHRLTPEKLAALAEHGFYKTPCSYSGDDYVITQALIDSGSQNRVFDKPLPLPFPVRLLQGGLDEDVPVETVAHLLRYMDCEDAEALILKNAGHRFNKVMERERILEAVLSIIERQV